MTANSSFGYTASASSEYSNSYKSHEAFNGNYKTVNGDSWISYPYSYVTTTGLPTDGTDSFQGTNGSWLKIQLQNTFKVQYVKIYPRNDGFPKKGKIYGSTDDSNWTQIYDFDDLLVATNDPVTLTVNSSNFYSYFVFHVEETGLWGTNTAYAAWVAIQELEYYGTPYTASTSDGTDVIFKSVPNTPKTDFLDVYYDASNTNSSSTVVKNIVDNSSATPVDLTFTSTDPKAWYFNGTTSNVTGTHGLGTGNVPHSHAVWFKRTSVVSPAGVDYIVSIGTRSISQASLVYIYSNQIYFDIFADFKLIANTIIENDTWYHYVVSYNGEDSTTKIYINGQPEGFTTIGIATLNLIGTTLALGSNSTSGDYFNGSIANYRLYDRALSADEVWELYGYQKAYFSVSPDVVTYKAGRVGIGTSEPRAVLDVVGDASISGGLKLPHMRVYRNADTDITHSGALRLDSIREDNFNGWDTTNYQYTVPMDGVYNICGSAYVTTGGSRFVIYVNDVSKVWLFICAAAEGHAAGSVSMRLNKDDIVNIRAISSCAIYYGISGYDTTWMSMTHTGIM